MNYDFYFQKREEIGKNILNYILNNGYSKASFAKKTDISRPTLDKILNGAISSLTTYNKHLEKISATLDKNKDYFAYNVIENTNIFNGQNEQLYAFSDRAPTDHKREPKIKEAFELLEDLFIVADQYVSDEGSL